MPSVAKRGRRVLNKRFQVTFKDITKYPSVPHERICRHGVVHSAEIGDIIAVHLYFGLVTDRGCRLRHLRMTKMPQLWGMSPLWRQQPQQRCGGRRGPCLASRLRGGFCGLQGQAMYERFIMGSVPHLEIKSHT